MIDRFQGFLDIIETATYMKMVNIIKFMETFLIIVNRLNLIFKMAVFMIIALLDLILIIHLIILNLDIEIIGNDTILHWF